MIGKNAIPLFSVCKSCIIVIEWKGGLFPTFSAIEQLTDVHATEGSWDHNFIC
jgi:hypothetical protein